MQKPKVNIIDHTTDKGALSSIFIVDPNPDKLELYNYEDLFLYVNLTAYPKSRSILIEEDDNLNFNSTINKNKGISFITTTEQNGDKYITTNYVNHNGVETTSEGFGITGIDIKIAANYVPTVKIMFHDVKGNTLRNFDINNGTIDSNNPLATFFTLPYPIYKLTVKGYYGKAVTYCLHKINFNASFNPDNGGVDIEATFVGFSYTFFSDISMKYLFSIGNTSKGRELLKQKNSISFSELLSGYSQLTKNIEELKINNPSFANVNKINNILLELNNIQTLIGIGVNENNSSLYGSNLNTNNITHLSFRDILLIKQSSRINYDIFINNLLAKIEQVNELMSTFSLSDILGTDYLIVGNQGYDNTLAINNIKTLINNNEPSFSTDIIDIDDITFNYNTNEIFFCINMYNLRADISKKIDFLNKIKKQNEEEILNFINKQKDILSFDPTLEGIFSIIAANMEVFLEVINEVAKKSSSISIQQQRLENFNNIQSDSKNNVIYPFPDVVIDNKKAWLGSVKNINEEYFPEISFVRELMQVVLDINNPVNNIDVIDNIINNEGRYENDLFPISAIDFSNPLDVNITNLNQLYDIVLKYAIEIMSYTWIGQDTQISDNIARFLGLYLKENNINPDIINAFINDDNNLTTYLNNTYQINNVNYNNTLQNAYYLNNSPYIKNDENSIIILLNNRYNAVDTNILYDTIKSRKSNYSNVTQNLINENQFRENITKKYKCILTSNDIIARDLSVSLLKPIIKNKLGENSVLLLSDLSQYDVNNNSILCRSSIPNTYSVFQENILDENMLKTKILFSLGYDYNIKPFFDSIDKSAIYSVPRFYLEFLGAIIYNINDRSWINDTRFSVYEKEVISSNINLLELINDDLKNELLNYYYDLQLSYLEQLFKTYSIAYYNFNINGYTSSIINNDIISENTSKILFEIKNDTKFVLLSPLYIYKNNNVKSAATLANLQSFFNNVKRGLNIQTSVNQSSNNTVVEITNDNNLILEMYYDIKAIYDKWISYDSTGKPFNVCFNTNKPLKEHFYFIDKAWNDIGSDVVLNPRTLISLFKEKNLNSYQYMTKILDDNNFITFFAPSYISFKNEDDVISMFTPNTTLLNAESLPSMISMYHGGISAFLNNDTNFDGDGFDFTENGLPKEFTLRKTSDRHTSDDDRVKYNLTSFLVNYGDDNQMHFKSLNVSSEEHQNTSAYFQTISEIFDKGGAINRFYQGIDIYDLYKLRSYKCKVEALGNFMYQPFQYFQLNIPFFKGAYMITDVSHILTPHNCVTTFTGIKISRVNYPLVDKITSFINLTFDAVNSYSKNNNISNVRNENSYARDRSLSVRGVDINVGNSTTILLSAENENDNIVNYIIKEGLDRNTFFNNLNRVFNSPSSYGIGGGLCMKWVKHALADLGIVSVPFGTLDAWDFIAGVDFNLLKFFNSTFIGNGGFKTYDYSSYINEDLSIIWGYFPTSNSKRVSIRAIKNKNNTRLITKLKEINLTNFEFNPVTHIGLVYKGVFYDLVNGRVRQNEKSSFVPIAYLPIYNKILNLIS